MDRMSINDKQVVLTKKTVSVLTHDESFHADDVLCIALLRRKYGKQNVTVLRKRPPDKNQITTAILHDQFLAEFDYVLDTGDENVIADDHIYLDHHEEPENKERYSNGVMMAACGKLAAILYADDVGYLNLLRHTLLYCVESKDNGQDMLDVLNVEDDIMAFVTLMKKVGHEKTSNDSLFEKAVDMAEEVLKRIEYIHESQRCSYKGVSEDELVKALDKSDNNLVIQREAVNKKTCIAMAIMKENDPKLKILVVDTSLQDMKDKLQGKTACLITGDIMYQAILTKNGMISVNDMLKDYVKQESGDCDPEKLFGIVKDALLPSREYASSNLDVLALFQFKRGFETESSAKKAFANQIKFSRILLKRALTMGKALIYADRKVREAAATTDSDTLVLGAGISWKSPLIKLNKDRKKKIRMVVFKDDSGAYIVQMVPTRKGSQQTYISAPYKWRGLKGEALEREGGIKGLLFCHPSGYMIRCSNKECAMRTADMVRLYSKMGYSESSEYEEDVIPI